MEKQKYISIDEIKKRYINILRRSFNIFPNMSLDELFDGFIEPGTDISTNVYKNYIKLLTPKTKRETK